MTGNSGTRKKSSAVIFALVMVVSVGAAGFAGGVAAVADNNQLDATNLAASDGVQSQTVSFTATQGDDFDDTGSSTNTITVAPVNSLSFSTVTNVDATRSTQGDVSPSGDGAVTAQVDGNGDLVVSIDESQLDQDTEDITIDVDMDVDASSASAGTSTYSLTSSAGTDQTVDFQVFESSSTGNPDIASVTKSGPSQLTIEFTEGVTDSDPGDNALTAGDITYVDNNGQDAGQGNGITGVQHTPGSSTLTATVDSVVTASDVGSDDVFATSSVEDIDDNAATGTQVTIQPTALAGGGNGAVSYDIDGSATQNIVAGSADQELNQIRVQDQAGGEFSGALTVSMPDGVSINESASNLNLNTVTTLDGTVTIDSVSVVNSGNDVEIDLSGTSSAGERLRIKSGALHVSTDGSTIDTTGTTTSLDVAVEHFSGTLNTDSDTSSNGLVRATHADIGNNDGTSTLNINQDQQDIGAQLDIISVDANEVGDNTDLVLSIEDGTGVSFNDQVKPGTLFTSLDPDGDTTEELDVVNATISGQTLTVPVNSSIDSSSTISFNQDTNNADEGVEFNVSGTASSPVDLNVTVESSSPSTGSYVVNSASGSSTVSDALTISSPTISYGSAEDPISVGANLQDVPSTLSIDGSTASIAQGSTINITTNSSAVTFTNSGDGDGTLQGSNFAGTDTSDITNVEIADNGQTLVIENGNGDITSSLDIAGSGGDADIDLNVSTAPADDTNVQFNATIDDTVSLSDSSNVLRLERPDTTFNGGNNATVDVDNDGEQQVIDNSQETIVITSDDISGQISDATNLTVTLESDTGVTFDRSATTNLDSAAANNDEIDVFGDTDSNLDNSDEAIFEGDNDGTFNAITVNDNSIELELDDENGDGASTSLAQGDAIVIDELPLNATADATNTTISVTTNTSDAEVTSDFASIVVANEVDPTAIQADADISSAGFGNDGADVTEDPAQSATETVTGAVRVQDSNDANFGGADVDLEVVETPDGSSGASVNASTVTTNSNGEAQFNFTAGDTTGDYVVNASVAGQDGASSSLNITYVVQAGSVASVSVEPIEDAISPRGAGTDAGTAALYVNATDAQGNKVGSQIDVELTVDSADASIENVFENVDADTTSGVTEGGATPSRTGSTLTTDNDGDTVVVLSDTTAEDVTVSAEFQGNSDSGTVTFFDNIGQVSVELNRSDVRTGQQVQANATIAQSDGTTITVPDISVDFDDDSSANTSFESPSVADNAVTASTDGNGLAQAVVEADAEGTAEIDVSSNLKSGSATLTIDDPDYAITDVTLDPNTVTGNQTVDHDLSYTVTGASNDGNSDTYTITLPNTTSFESANSLNVTDINGDEISISSGVSLADANGGTDNQLTFGIQPDSSFDTAEVNVDANVSVSFPAVEETTEGNITLDVSDSNNGNTNATTGITIEPEAQAPTASVTFNDQTVQNNTETVTVDSANLTENGEAADYVVVVHVVGDEFDGGVSGPVGVSGNLSGSAENISVDLNASGVQDDALDSITENTTLRAMLHETSADSAFGSAIQINGSTVTDDANITVEQADDDGDIVDQFDEDGDGIESPELLDAITAFRNDEVTAPEILTLIENFRQNN